MLKRFYVNTSLMLCYAVVATFTISLDAVLHRVTNVFVVNAIQQPDMIPGNKLVVIMGEPGGKVPLVAEAYWPAPGTTFYIPGLNGTKRQAANIAQITRSYGLFKNEAYTFSQALDLDGLMVNLTQEVTGTAYGSALKVGLNVPTLGLKPKVVQDNRWHTLEIPRQTKNGTVSGTWLINYCCFQTPFVPLDSSKGSIMSHFTPSRIISGLGAIAASVGGFKLWRAELDDIYHDVADLANKLPVPVVPEGYELQKVRQEYIQNNRMSDILIRSFDDVKKNGL